MISFILVTRSCPTSALLPFGNTWLSWEEDCASALAASFFIHESTPLSVELKPVVTIFLLFNTSITTLNIFCLDKVKTSSRDKVFTPFRTRGTDNIIQKNNNVNKFRFACQNLIINS